MQKSIDTNRSGWNFRNSGVAVPSWLNLGQVRKSGHVLLDPMCGSGSSCVSALIEGRRFIGIDINPYAIETTWHRCMEVLEGEDYIHQRKADGEQMRIRIKVALRNSSRLEFASSTRLQSVAWNNGDSYLILGDSFDVMQSMPRDLIDLVYIDPPFATERTFKATQTFPKWLQKQRKKRSWPELGQSDWELPS